MNIFFILSGLFSSLISLTILELESLDWIGPGLIFALTLTLLLRKHLAGKHEKLKFTGLVTSAYVIAYAITFTINFFFDGKGLSYTARKLLACAPFILGGVVGGWLLFLALRKYIFKEGTRANAAIFSIFGGLLSASILIAEIPRIKAVLNTGHPVAKYLLLDQNYVDMVGQVYPYGTGLMFVAWQVGMAILIAQYVKKLNV